MAHFFLLCGGQATEPSYLLDAGKYGPPSNVNLALPFPNATSNSCGDHALSVPYGMSPSWVMLYKSVRHKMTSLNFV